MELISADEFWRSAQAHGVGPDPRYPASDHPAFAARRDGPSRFWTFPTDATELAHFADALVGALGAWTLADAYVPRRWADPATGPEWPNAHVWNTLLEGFGIGRAFQGAVRVRPAERVALVALVFTYASLGAALLNDLVLVPDTGQSFAFLEHHHVVWVHATTDEEMERIITHMASVGYELPTEAPDATFKAVSWLDESGQSRTNGA